MAVSHDSRIRIVGAGLGGTHLAFELRRCGFRDVVILEATDRVGGDIDSFERDGVIHELGACYTSPAYRPVHALARELGLSSWQTIEPGLVFDGSLEGEQFESYLVRAAAPYVRVPRGIPPVPVVKVAMLSAVRRYLKLHRRLLGDYDGTIVPRPSRAALAELDCTFAELLARHHLQVLTPVLRQLHTSMCYGYLETVPAFYGLSWCNPMMMRMVLANAPGARRTGDPETRSACMLDGGLAALVDRMIDRGGIAVRHGAEVHRLQRRDDGVTITYGPGHTEEADFVFSSLPLPHLAEIADCTAKEQKMFAGQRSSSVTVSLVEAPPEPRLGIVGNWYDALVRGREHEPFKERCSARVFGEPRGGDVEARVWYQYGETDLAGDERRARLAARADALHGAGRWSVAQERTVRYFHRWGLSDVTAGRPWDLMDWQGTRRTYAIGGPAYFESMVDIVNLNTEVLRRFARAESTVPSALAAAA